MLNFCKRLSDACLELLQCHQKWGEGSYISLFSGYHLVIWEVGGRGTIQMAALPIYRLYFIVEK